MKAPLHLQMALLVQNSALMVKKEPPLCSCPWRGHLGPPEPHRIDLLSFLFEECRVQQPFLETPAAPG